MESLLGYHPCSTGFLTSSRDPAGGTMSGGEFDWGGRLRKGIGGAQRFPLRMVGNHSKSAKAEGSLTATPTGEQVRK